MGVWFSKSKITGLLLIICETHNINIIFHNHFNTMSFNSQTSTKRIQDLSDIQIFPVITFQIPTVGIMYEDKLQPNH